MCLEKKYYQHTRGELIPYIPTTLNKILDVGCGEGLIQLKEMCAAEGDYFLYNRLAKILQDSPSPEEWTQLGDKALGLGKLLFARFAYERADNQEKAAQVEKLRQLPPQERTSGGKMLH